MADFEFNARSAAIAAVTIDFDLQLAITDYTRQELQSTSQESATIVFKGAGIILRLLPAG